jgi:hypothetical protein
LERPQKYSTELLINVSVPIIHRLSCKKKIWETGIIDEATDKWHNTLSAALGGDYWKKYLLDGKLDAKEQIELTMREYQENIRKYLPFVGACPVYESTEDSTIKFYLVFASRHIDSAILLNDIMFNAYYSHIWGSESRGTLFEGTNHEVALPSDYNSSLEKDIMKNIGEKGCSRINLWKRIVYTKFMRYKKSDFIKSVKSMVDSNKVDFKDIRGTGKLNDDSFIYFKKIN